MYPEYVLNQYRQKSSETLVVIPVLNEGTRIRNLLNRMVQLGINMDFDIIVTDGRSEDGSVENDQLEKMGITAKLTRVSEGKLGTQLQCAYSFALANDYKYVVTIDGNDKDDPAFIAKVKTLLISGFDFVQASRFVENGYHENTPISRLLAIKLIHAPLLSLSSGFRWTDTTQGFRGYSRKLLADESLDIFRAELSDYKLLFYISHRAPKLGFRCTEVGTTRIYPKNEEVPTKIKGLRGNIKVLISLISVSLGKYDNPRN